MSEPSVAAAFTKKNKFEKKLNNSEMEQLLDITVTSY
jgi:hypothetical protein